jgi:acyl carrier protein
MTPEQTFARLVRRHLKYLAPERDIDREWLLKDYGLDSAAAIDLLLDLEDAYGITMPDKYLTEETFATLASLWSAVSQFSPASQTVGASS